MRELAVVTSHYHTPCKRRTPCVLHTRHTRTYDGRAATRSSRESGAARCRRRRTSGHRTPSSTLGMHVRSLRWQPRDISTVRGEHPASRSSRSSESISYRQIILFSHLHSSMPRPWTVLFRTRSHPPRPSLPRRGRRTRIRPVRPPRPTRALAYLPGAFPRDRSPDRNRPGGHPPPPRFFSLPS